MNCRNKQWRNPTGNSMKKKLQDLLDNYSSLLTLMEKRRDEDMARLYKIEVQLMNLIEVDLKKKKPTKRKTK
jgi:hypothetical protein